MARFLIILIAFLSAMPVCAQDEPRAFIFGGDAFLAGRSVTHDAAGSDDLFMAGERVVGKTAITGSAHLAGREVTMDGGIGGDAYAAGEEIALRGDVVGDATLAGRSVSVAGVGGDLRVAGSELRLGGAIGGTAMIAGEVIAFDAVVSGDVSLAAKRVAWGETASIGGRLIVFEEEPGETDVPERVVPAGRVERREIEDWDGPKPPSWGRVIVKFLMGVVVVAALAALVAALVPERLAEMRRQVLARPFHTLWIGFMAQSAIIGAGVLFALTIIGLLLTPALVVLAIAAGFAGYVVAAYAFGVGLLLAFGRPDPDSIAERALAAGVGALTAGLIGLIPFLGWLFILVLVLSGIGAITVRTIRPVFFADTY